jgi:hypothetical protein
MQVKKLENNVYHTQYILDDGSMILVSDKFKKVFIQNGKCVRNSNQKVIHYMSQELDRFLAKQAV